MTVEQWRIVVGVVVSAVLAAGPWMFMVHAKLAVLSSQVAMLCQKMDKASATQERLWSVHASHDVKIETHNVQIAQISQRLHELLEQ